MTVEELTGGWVDDDGNQLVIVPDTSTYDYRTWYGRVGFGPFEVVDDRPVIEYDGFYYDFEADGDGFLLRQNGASDRAGLDGARFGPGESDVYAPELTTLDGIWQDALGETLVIDTDRMEYLAYSPDGMTGGTICDGGDGLGVYLFLNGRGYFAVSPDGNSFTLFFEASDTNAPDGTYEGVFYRNGDADLYAELDDAEFYASDGHLRYYDGENIFFLPDTYAVAADGLAYDGAGNVYAAGWDTPYYDPCRRLGRQLGQQLGLTRTDKSSGMQMHSAAFLSFFTARRPRRLGWFGGFRRLGAFGGYSRRRRSRGSTQRSSRASMPGRNSRMRRMAENAPMEIVRQICSMVGLPKKFSDDRRDEHHDRAGRQHRVDAAAVGGDECVAHGHGLAHLAVIARVEDAVVDGRAHEDALDDQQREVIDLQPPAGRRP